MKKAGKRKWNPAYAGWSAAPRNGRFDRTAKLTESERIDYVAAMKRLVRVYCRPIEDEGLRRWTEN